MSVDPIPEDYRSITPYLVVRGAAAALDFYRRAFGAEEILRLPMGDRIGHAELRIGNSIVMLADEFPEMDILGPQSRGGATSSLLLYTEDVDAMFARAVDAGATAERPPEDQFYGDRMGTLRDPFGQRWSVATHKEDVPEDEMRRRMEAMSAGAAAPAAAEAV
ncbi:VOC family protein [Sphingomonas parva]|uniref:VOC family protein n=1 Tax=Sphingomonas parva TaxID=2555898 RepID=A0A4Y8ZT43_9SPHN|nr:VOC family protein [Sphingomonas parva]TFI57929.1 VOC family protein [Sphingomonas parva]